MIYNPACDLCELHKTATNRCVPGDGNINGTLLVVGLAPGETEDRTNRVFAGKSGRLFREMLKENGLDPYIHNAVNCRPPGNREPNAAEVKACSIYLERVVKAMPNLKYIVALGSLPMKACGVDGSVMKLAGVPRPVFKWGRNLTVVPVLHPAAILRRPSSISTWESHWHQIRNLVNPPSESFASKVGARIYPKGLEGKDWRT